MNALKLLTNKWVLAIGIAIRIIAAASVTQAAPPGHDARGDGFRGQPDGGRQVYVDHGRDNARGDDRAVYADRDGGRGNDRPVYVDRNVGRDNDDHGQFDGPAWRGGFDRDRAPGFVPVPAPYRQQVPYGGVGPAGVRVIGGMGGLGITIIIR
jgi:hypothetical protein